jgi:nucleotide-binding universal stress UspA family protein
MLRSILVPLDGSDFAEHALPVALGIARRSGAEVHVASVHAPPPPDPDLAAEWDQEVRQAQQEYLDRLGERLRAVDGVDAHLVLLDGLPGEALSRQAAAVGADLIVMTTHGRTGLSRLWFGSVANDVVRHGHVPTLLVRPGAQRAEMGGPHRFTHVLVPLDGSDRAAEVLPFATGLGALDGARLTLLQVVMPPLPPVHPYSFAVPVPEPDPHALAVHVQRARERLAAVADTLRARGLHVECIVRTHDRPAEAILTFVAESGADLVAMTTHGRGLSRLVTGSIADKVLRGARTPVLLYRTEGRREA